jgi:hypothetical protein
MKYIKKPIPIEAYQLGITDITPDWFMDAMTAGIIQTHTEVERSPFDCSRNVHITATIKTLEGVFKCKFMDYIIKGIRGEIYCCDREIFEESYERCEQ